MEFDSSLASAWREALLAYEANLDSLRKPDLLPLDAFYRCELPLLLHGRNPDPFITKPELRRLMQWKLSRGKWRPRLLDFVSSLDESQVEIASRKGFQCLPDLSKAISELTVLKGVGPATASAVLAAYAPEVAPFMSDEAVMASMGSLKDYSLKQYLVFAEKLQSKAKELSENGDVFTPSDVERALWSSAIKSKLKASQSEDGSEAGQQKRAKRKRKF
ncbi:DNA-glycosylase protein [Dioscorea alata]|uniref:DNA-glycosylase protein n=1 Tax=Dioscorea alata TaxID=55571 RepID=A0ACB7WNN1_DIOAL|nr:DNA-glycosylase protein [Dioscorea alata]